MSNPGELAGINTLIEKTTVQKERLCYFVDIYRNNVSIDNSD